MADSKNIKPTSDSSFKSDILEAPEVALVDFWAEWCGPCKMLAPTIEAIADQFEGKAKIYKMNVDENPNTPTQFNVRGLPTVIIFKNGEAVETLVGNQPQDTITKAIEKALS